MSAAEPCGNMFPPRFIPKINAINIGVGARPVLVKTWMTGMNIIVTGTLSKNPDRREVKIRINMLTRNKLLGVIKVTKSSRARSVPLTSMQ